MNDNKQLLIFRRLAKKGTYLEHATVGGHSDQIAYRLYPADERGGGKLAVTEEDLRGWLADGLLAPCETGYRLSPEGVAWLKRRLATSQEFQSQHQDRAVRVIDFEGAKRPAMVNEAESPLAWLASRKDKSGAPLLAAFQFEAGERLRADYQFAGLTARVTASWNPVAGGGNRSSSNDMSALQDNVMAARQRVVRALAAVGPELCGVLVDVCCHLKGLEQAEKTEGWPQRSGKIILQIALTRLARHYGLVGEGQSSAGLARRLQHWGAQDYRPKLSGEAG